MLDNYHENPVVFMFVRFMDIFTILFYSAAGANAVNLVSFDFINHTFQLILTIVGGALTIWWMYYRGRNERFKYKQNLEDEDKYKESFKTEKRNNHPII
jgi:hypothetical protein